MDKRKGLPVWQTDKPSGGGGLDHRPISLRTKWNMGPIGSQIIAASPPFRSTWVCLLFSLYSDKRNSVENRISGGKNCPNASQKPTSGTQRRRESPGLGARLASRNRGLERRLLGRGLCGGEPNCAPAFGGGWSLLSPFRTGANPPLAPVVHDAKAPASRAHSERFALFYCDCRALISSASQARA